MRGVSALLSVNLLSARLNGQGFLQGLCTLVAIAMVHSDNRLACAIAMTLFATGIALSLLLIAAYSRPFTGEISVGPDLLKQVITSEAKVGSSR